MGNSAAKNHQYVTHNNNGVHRTYGNNVNNNNVNNNVNTNNVNNTAHNTGHNTAHNTGHNTVHNTVHNTGHNTMHNTVNNNRNNNLNNYNYTHANNNYWTRDKYNEKPKENYFKQTEDFRCDLGPDECDGAGTPYQHVVFRAAKAGDLEAVKYWIEEMDFYIDEQDFYCNSVLYYSALCSRHEIVKYLISKGAAFSRKEREGERIYIATTDNQLHKYLATVDQSGRKFKEDWFTNYINNAEFSDLQFVIQSDTSSPIPAHRALIAARCPALLPQIAEGYVNIDSSISRKDFLDVLYYLYTDRLSITLKNRQVVRKIASDFSVVDTKQKMFDLGPALSTMVNNPLYSDISLVTQEGESVHAHKVVLAHKSDYFKAMFGNNNWAEKDVLKLPVDVAFDILLILLNYMYSRTYAVTPDNILDVLAAADRFLLIPLKSELESTVVRTYLDFDSCIDLFLFAESTNCEDLRKACVAKFKQRGKQLEDTPKFLELPPETQAALQNRKKPKK